MTMAQRFTVRSTITAMAAAIVAYLTGAFVEASWNVATWPADDRSEFAFAYLLLGGFAAFVAGMSAKIA